MATERREYVVKRGGKREGAGRPSRDDEPMVQLTVFLPEKIASACRARAKIRSGQEGRQVGVSEVIRDLLEDSHGTCAGDGAGPLPTHAG